MIRFIVQPGSRLSGWYSFNNYNDDTNNPDNATPDIVLVHYRKYDNIDSNDTVQAFSALVNNATGR